MWGALQGPAHISVAPPTHRWREHRRLSHARRRVQAQIQQLTAALYESGAAGLAGLKAQLARSGAALAAAGDGREELPYEQVGAARAWRTRGCGSWQAIASRAVREQAMSCSTLGV